MFRVIHTGLYSILLLFILFRDICAGLHLIPLIFILLDRIFEEIRRALSIKDQIDTFTRKFSMRDRALIRPRVSGLLRILDHQINQLNMLGIKQNVENAKVENRDKRFSPLSFLGGFWNFVGALSYNDHEAFKNIIEDRFKVLEMKNTVFSN